MAKYAENAIETKADAKRYWCELTNKTVSQKSI